MSAGDLLAVDGLSVRVGQRWLLRDVTFTLRPGEALTVLGESGAGKSLLAQAVMGNLPPALRADGSVALAGEYSAANEPARRRPRWGRGIALLPQEPMLALDPLRRLAPQLAEVHRLVVGADRTAADAAALRQLDAAGLGATPRQYPWQLSGGMAQRAAATIALAGGARIVLADEPTKGLDARWRDHAVAALQAVQRDGGCVVVVTHDLRVAAALGGRLIVLRAGEVVEQGRTASVLAEPRHAFTRQLVAAEPAHWPQFAAPPRGRRVVSADGLRKGFGGRPLFDRLDLRLDAGERLVLQGPSGTGKSTLGNVLLGLLAPDAGCVRRGDGLAPTAFQKLYQDPATSFAPLVRLDETLRDAARLHRCAWPRVEQRLARLQLAPDLLERRPGEVSGGELQRLAMVRAMTAEPVLLFADEPTSRLDPVTQKQAMKLLLGLVDDAGAALLLVTHDDDIARAVATRTLRFGEGQTLVGAASAGDGQTIAATDAEAARPRPASGG